MTVPLLAIAAWSGTGKTTLLENVIPLLKARGIRPGLIKHTHHNMDVDKPGKDSFLLRKAGADQVIVASNQRWALMCETPDKPLTLHQLAARMDNSSLDLVLIEGFKDEPVAKILLWRTGVKGDITDLLDNYVVAVASDVKVALSLPVLDINQPLQVADFIAEWCFSQKNP